MVMKLIEHLFQNTIAVTLATNQDLGKRIKDLEEEHEKFRNVSSEQSDEKLIQLQAQFNVLKCEKTLSSEVGVEHVKNMLLSYHTSEDEAIKKNSLRVLFKALDFSDEE